jgi:PIN domain nuclease of toxin-antitoxin system
VKLLLDTHIALWALAEPRRLPRDVADRLRDPRNAICVSVVSLWEVAIKHSLVCADGRRKLDVAPHDLLVWLDKTGFDVLAVAPAHCVEVAALPYRADPANGRVHGDPFDRMLVAQALSEPMRLVTADPLIALHMPDAAGLIEVIAPVRR